MGEPERKEASTGQEAPQKRRFRINPVELVIFSVISLVFLNSVYNLFYDWRGFRPAKVALLEGGALDSGYADEKKTNSSFLNLEVECTGDQLKETAAGKLRLAGALCSAAGGDDAGRQPASAAGTLIRTEITNQANNASATVFTDVNAGKYSTDYLPLEQGENPINIRFVYHGGKVVTRQVRIVRR